MEELKNEERPIISAGAPKGSRPRKTISVGKRYIINTVLVVLFLAIGDMMVGQGIITRYQTSVLEQVGIYIIMAVSLNIATGYRSATPASCRSAATRAPSSSCA